MFPISRNSRRGRRRKLNSESLGCKLEENKISQCSQCAQGEIKYDRCQRTQSLAQARYRAWFRRSRNSPNRMWKKTEGGTPVRAEAVVVTLSVTIAVRRFGKLTLIGTMRMLVTLHRRGACAS